MNWRFWQRRKDKAAQERRRRVLRRKITLTTFLSLTVVVIVAITSSAASRYAFLVLQENKLRDTWALFFLEFERKAHSISRAIEMYQMQDGRNTTALVDGETIKSPGVVFRIDPETKVLHGVLGTRGQIQEAALPLDLAAPTEVQIVRWKKTDYLARVVDLSQETRIQGTVLPSGSYVFLWKMPIRDLLKGLLKSSAKANVYVANRAKTLFYTNRRDITEETFEARPLVQHFIKVTISQGELEFQGDEGHAFFGSFYEIPKTNLVIFAETEKSVALAPVRVIAHRYLLAAVIVLVMTLILIQIPLYYVNRPIRELVSLTKMVSAGQFNVAANAKSFGDLQALTDSFSTMASSLIERDKSIEHLIIEKQEKLRLVRELEVARGIQDGLLPQDALPAGSGLKVAAKYVPALEVAGDWYQYRFSPAAGETVIAIADVSGHGAGASMFTAICADLFEEVLGGDREFSIESFLVKLNSRFRRFGSGRWHSTMLLLSYRIGEDVIRIYGAGHPPLLFLPKGGGASKMVAVPSQPIGLAEEFAVKIRELPFAADDILILYTDGLIECKNANDVAYGTKRLRRLCEGRKTSDLDQLLTGVMADWNTHRGGGDAADDVCMVGVQRA